MKKVAFILIMGLIGGLISGCTDADVASANLSKAADMFQINRRIVFYNGITGEYMLTIQGLCSINDEKNQLEVTCKVGTNQYKKHHYKVIFKPSVIVPDIEIK